MRYFHFGDEEKGVRLGMRDANWSPSSVMLGKDTSSVASGAIVGIGEPTLATIGGGKTVLFFVYVQTRGYDSTTHLPDLDLQAGYVPMR